LATAGVLSLLCAACTVAYLAAQRPGIGGVVVGGNLGWPAQPGHPGPVSREAELGLGGQEQSMWRAPLTREESERASGALLGRWQQHGKLADGALTELMPTGQPR
jgi:hypothetical protein